MTVIANTAWDSGNFFNTDAISNNLKNFITMWPIWGFYRGWLEYEEYAQQVSSYFIDRKLSLISIQIEAKGWGRCDSGQAAYRGVPGLEWSDLTDDPMCGMGPVMVTMVVEWPLFLAIAFYLDQVLPCEHL